ncbi:MAG: hypothetical protein KF837_33905 [Labilithrix sp.]|nr:hypothetical protein [Labilithrix sp.]
MRGCVRKQLAWDNQRRRKAERENEALPEFPYLWLLSTGDPKTVTESYELEPSREGWPKGFRFDAPGHAIGVVVLSELARVPETLLLRLLGRDAVLQDAIADARTLESGELRRMILELLVRRRMVMPESEDSEDRKEAAMLEQEFQQFKKAMRDEGKAEGKAEAILRVFDARELQITNTERARILACTDLAQLDRWLERAVSATLRSRRARRLIIAFARSKPCERGEEGAPTVEARLLEDRGEVRLDRAFGAAEP